MNITTNKDIIKIGTSNEPTGKYFSGFIENSRYALLLPDHGWFACIDFPHKQIWGANEHEDREIRVCLVHDWNQMDGNQDWNSHIP